MRKEIIARLQKLLDTLRTQRPALSEIVAVTTTTPTTPPVSPKINIDILHIINAEYDKNEEPASVIHVTALVSVTTPIDRIGVIDNVTMAIHEDHLKQLAEGQNRRVQF